MKTVFKICTLVVCIGTLFAFTTINNPEKIKVVIDASHGGQDSGAMYDGLTEKAILASIAKKIKTLNTNQNIELIFTRNEDETMTLNDRVTKINSLNPDLVISLHINNSKNTDSNGIEAFVSKDLSHSIKSEELATKLLEILTTKTNLKSRGVKQAPFFILKKSNCPSIIVELGFLSNPNDRSFLMLDENQDKIASAVLDFASQIK